MRGQARVIIAAALPPPVHGQSAVTAAVLEELRSRQVEIEVLDLSPGTLSRSISYHVRRITRTVRAVARILSQSHLATLYTVLEADRGVVYNFGILAAGRLAGVRIFIHHHTAAHVTRRGWLVGALFRLAGAQATHVVLSEGMMEDVKALYRVANVLIAHNARFAGEAQQRVPRAAPLRVGLLSNLSVEKGLDLAIETVVRGREEGLPLSLVLAGPAADAEAKGLLENAQSRLGGALDYRGAVHGDAKQAFFEDVDVFLFPTRYRNEAQPLVVLEALSRGIPCLARDQGYVGELVGDAEATIPPDATYPETAVRHLRAWAECQEQFELAQSLALTRFSFLLRASLAEFETLIVNLTTVP